MCVRLWWSCCYEAGGIQETGKLRTGRFGMPGAFMQFSAAKHDIKEELLPLNSQTST